jgi:hypothetical protein
VQQSEQAPEFLMTQQIKIEQRITKFWWIREPDKKKNQFSKRDQGNERKGENKENFTICGGSR